MGINSEICFHDFNKINKILPKCLNKLIYTYSSDHPPPRIENFLKNLEENTEWRYVSEMNQQKGIEITFYKKKCVVDKTYQYSEDDTIFEELLISYKRMYYYEKIKQDQKYSHFFEPHLYNNILDNENQKNEKLLKIYLKNHRIIYLNLKNFFINEYGFNTQDFTTLCVVMYNRLI